MKKKILILIAIFVLISIVGIVLFSIFGSKDENQSPTDNLIEDNIDFLKLFACDTISELQAVSKENNIELQQFEDGKYWGLDGYKISSLDISLAVQFEEDKITGTSTRIVFAGDYSEVNDKIYQIQEALDYSNFLCTALFNADTTGYINIFHIDGYLLDTDLTQAYNFLVSNEAYSLLVVKESDNSYWKIRGFLEDNKFVLYMDRIFQNLDDSFADIILE